MIGWLIAAGVALLPFVVLAHAFPWPPAARTARETVAVLLEMIADDHACRAHGTLPLARALVRMAAGEPGPAGAGVVERLRRLLTGPSSPDGCRRRRTRRPVCCSAAR